MYRRTSTLADRRSLIEPLPPPFFFFGFCGRSKRRSRELCPPRPLLAWNALYWRRSRGRWILRPLPAFLPLRMALACCGDTLRAAFALACACFIDDLFCEEERFSAEVLDDLDDWW